MEGIYLVTGGARSGKSRFAEKLIAALGNRIAYIATAQILDDEMRARVKLHRERRSLDWRTFESPFNADETIEKIRASQNFDAILFDCVTIYLSNLICSFENLDDQISVAVKNSVDKLILSAENFARDGGKIIFVTNEVGAGIVPENRLARMYRDIAGLANQQIANHSERVILVASGIPIDLRKVEFKI